MKTYSRQTNRFIEERKNEKGQLLCLVPTCNEIRERRKNGSTFRNYCKNHNADDMRLHTNWRELRESILKRDNYVCKVCGDNRQKIEVIKIIKVSWNNKINNWNTIESKEMKSNFVVDHIKPIAIGGAEFDPNNLWTLCLSCNKIKTKKDMKDIANYRKISEKQEIKNA